MAEESTYVGKDQEFRTFQKRYKVSEIGKYANFVESAMRVCGRDGDYFASYAERNQWMGIAEGMEKNMIPLTWVKLCIKWAIKKNFLKVCVPFPSLTTFILNEAKMQDWLALQGIKKDDHWLRPGDPGFKPRNWDVYDEDPRKRSW